MTEVYWQNCSLKKNYPQAICIANFEQLATCTNFNPLKTGMELLLRKCREGRILRNLISRFIEHALT